MIRFRMRSDREGVAIALVAVFIIALLAVLSLGIELGMAYVGKTDAQRVADAAALAGASAFLDFTSPYGAAETEAETRAKEYVGRNVVRARSLDPETESVVHVLPDSQKVRVWVTKGGLPTWTAKLLGFDEITVRAMATAEAIRAGSATCVKPFALPDRWEEFADDIDADQTMDFDEYSPCHGSACNGNEIWTYDPELGDQYRPIVEDQSNLATATSWGSTWQDPNRDVGARMLISPQYAMDAGTPGWYQYWQMPDADGGTQSGARALTDAIKACVSLGEIGIGDDVSSDPELDSEAQGQTGNIGKPVYDAVREVLDSEPRPMAWDDALNKPYYTDVEGGDYDVFGSPRIWTVLLVNPGDIQQGSSHTMEIMDMVTLWLEDPIDVYGQGQPDHHLPITGRMVHWGSGAVGPKKGNLQKVLRLVE